jgi:hypothetical protein
MPCWIIVFECRTGSGSSVPSWLVFLNARLHGFAVVVFVFVFWLGM